VARPACGSQRLVWLLRASGAQWLKWVDCGRWDCPKCARDRMTAAALHLARCTDKAWIVLVPPAWVPAVRRSVRGDDGLRLSLSNGGMYLANGRETSGHGWRTAPIPTVDVALLLTSWPHARPTKTTWTGRWRPKTVPPDTDDPVVLHYAFDDDEHLRTTLKHAGVPTWVDLDPTDVEGAVRRVRATLDRLDLHQM